ncbi:hypothetical protein HRbin37_00443 [bacterium HR37]|nr:hypothetical protein HRbin37_00443 [bacterium HR37]
MKSNGIKSICLFTIFFVIYSLMASCSVVRFARYYASSDTDEGKFKGRVYRSRDTAYSIGVLSEGWKRIDLRGGDIAFWNEALKATITVNSTCNERIGNEPLNNLVDSLLVGFSDKELERKEEVTVSGQRAIDTVYRGKVKDTYVKLNIVVLKKDNCVYDLTYASLPESFDLGIGEFREFVSQFRILKK